MVGTIRVFTDPGTLHRTDAGPVSGALWLEIGGAVFPARGWTDFALVVLKAWAHALIGIGRGGGRAEVYFLEGPYRIGLERMADGQIRIEAGKRDAPGGLIAELPLSMLAGTVSAAAATALDACHRRGIRSADADALEDAVARLRAASN